MPQQIPLLIASYELLGCNSGPFQKGGGKKHVKEIFDTSWCIERTAESSPACPSHSQFGCGWGNTSFFFPRGFPRSSDGSTLDTPKCMWITHLQIANPRHPWFSQASCRDLWEAFFSFWIGRGSPLWAQRGLTGGQELVFLHRVPRRKGWHVPGWKGCQPH